MKYTATVRAYLFVLLEIVPMLDVFLWTLSLGRIPLKTEMKSIQMERPMSQTGQTALPQVSRFCGTEDMETVALAFNKLIKWRVVIMTPINPLM